MVPSVPLPPLNIASSSSAGANTGGFSIGGLSMGPTSGTGQLAAQLPLLVAVAALGMVLILKKT